MKKRKPSTKPLSCRVPIEMATEVIAKGQEMGMIPAEYIQHLLILSFYGENGLKNLELRVQDAEARMEHLKSENEKLKQQCPWQLEPLKTKLASILNNEKILAALFIKYKLKSFPLAELEANDFNFRFQLSPVRIGGINYAFMNHYGWGFADNTQQTVMIRKDH